MERSATIPVLEIGGSHVTAASVLFRDGSAGIVQQRTLVLEPGWGRDEIVETLARAADHLGEPSGRMWGVAIPGPFDYERGIALFTAESVGKFAALHGLDLRDALVESLSRKPAGIRFLNDADAFGLGEFRERQTFGYRRAVFLTLGSGVGSAFVDRGKLVKSGPSVPPQGYMYLVEHDGRPLEEIVSRRAIRRQYSAKSGCDLDVQEIATRARAGEKTASELIANAMSVLGRALAPWCAAFSAEAVVVAGAMADSWDLIGSPILDGLREALTGCAVPALIRADDGKRSQLIGAAHATLT
jgi:glucokinase